MQRTRFDSFGKGPSDEHLYEIILKQFKRCSLKVFF